MLIIGSEEEWNENLAKGHLQTRSDSNVRI
jgi:hypothetical protein